MKLFEVFSKLSNFEKIVYLEFRTLKIFIENWILFLKDHFDKYKGKSQ